MPLDYTDPAVRLMRAQYVYAYHTCLSRYEGREDQEERARDVAERITASTQGAGKAAELRRDYHGIEV